MLRLDKVTTIGALFLLGVVSARAQKPGLVEHYCPNCGGALTSGVDGAMWFGPEVGAIVPVGVITLLPQLNCFGITEGPDGAMWFTTYAQAPSFPVIGRISSSGAVTAYPVPVPGSDTRGAYLYAITAGPDGALWFTLQGGSVANDGLSQIGRMTVSGEVTLYSLPALGSNPSAITSGPDGNLWFIEVGGVGRITPAGVITEFPITGGTGHGIAAGPDGALWVTEDVAQRGGAADIGAIMRITTDGAITQYSMTEEDMPNGITSGPNNTMWFTNGNQVQSVTMNGTFDYVVSTSKEAGGIATAPDGSIWLNEDYGIGQIIMQTATLSASPTTAYPGSSLTLTGSGYLPGESVNLYAHSTGAYRLGTATVDSAGSFTTTLKVPELIISGRQTVVGVGATSENIAVAPYTLNPLLWPSSTVVSPGSSITVSGFGFSPNEDLYLDWFNGQSQEIWSGACDEDGAFYGPTAVNFTIPEGTSPGSYQISAFRENGLGVTVYITVQ